MLDVSKKTSDAIYQHVAKDLKPGHLAVLWRIGASLLTGGLASLFFCGQFGIGFSAMAKGWNHMLHAHVGEIQCAIICGVAFAIAPVIVLRLISSALLFRTIIRNYSMTQAGLILISGLFMYVSGTFMNELINIGIWSLSAFISFKLIGLIFGELSRLVRTPDLV